MRRRHGYGQGPNKAQWMQKFEEKAYELGAPRGRLDWATANYLFAEGVGPFDAASRLYGRDSAS